MRSQIQLGRIHGIKIGLHYSWFFIALLIVFSLSDKFRTLHPEWGKENVVGLAVITAVLFFVSLLLHELAHSLVATARGLPVKEITLFALGGVSQIEGEAATAKTEFSVAVVGPFMSLVIGLLCLGVVKVLGISAASPVSAVLSWLGFINLGLAGFNLLPGYPLDGGRILRAILWWKTGDVERATRGASKAGQVVAAMFIALGIAQFFLGAGISGLWIAFVGWFLMQAATESYVQLGLRQALAGARARDIMTKDCPTVNGNMNVKEFVENELLRTGRRCFAVTDYHGLTGLITPHEIKEVDRAKWPYTTLHDVMRPLENTRTVLPDASLNDVLEVMSRDNLNQLPVVSEGHLEGVLSRAEILNYLQTRAEMRA